MKHSASRSRCLAVAAMLFSAACAQNHGATTGTNGLQGGAGLGGGGMGAPSLVTGTPASTPMSTTVGPSTTTSASGSAWCNAYGVLHDTCQQCHGTARKYGAPMSMVTYDDMQKPAVTDNTKKVWQMVSVRTHDTAKPMPPTGYAPLAAPALSALDTWIAGGALAGADPTCSGRATATAASSPTTSPTATTGMAGSAAAATTGSAGSGATGAAGATADTTADMPWPADCEMHYKFLANTNGSGKYTVAAGAEEHPSFYFTPTWPANSQGVMFKPITDNAKVLHHWILYAGDGAFISGWAPGNDAGRAPLPADVGIYLPAGAGAQLRLDTHYNNVGGTTAEQDASGVEVCVISNKLRKNVATVHGFTANAYAPAHSTNFDDTSTCTMSGTAHVLSGSPHMHKLGVHAKLVFTQGGKQNVVHDAAFDFNEQRVHSYTPELLLNTGDQVTTTCTYTNPTDQDVYFGQNTENEMCFNFVLYYPKDGFTCF